MSRYLKWMWVVCWSFWLGGAWAGSGSINGYPTVSLQNIPQPLQELYMSYLSLIHI